MVVWLMAVLAAAPALSQGKAKAKGAPDAGQPAAGPGAVAPTLPTFSPTGQALLPDGGVAEQKADIAPGQEKPKTRYFEGMGRTPEEEQKLTRHYVQTQDVKTAARLVTANLRLVVKLAHDSSRKGSSPVPLWIERRWPNGSSDAIVR